MKAVLARRGSAAARSRTIGGGFGDPDNIYIRALTGFKDQFYAGTRSLVRGGQVWRSENGSTWSRVELSGLDPIQGEIVTFTVFNDQIIASTWSFSGTQGAEIWNSTTGDDGDWIRRVSNGFNGDTNNEKFVSFEEYNGYLYVGTDNIVTGAELWRCQTCTGEDWQQVPIPKGFGDTENRAISWNHRPRSYIECGRMAKTVTAATSSDCISPSQASKP